MTTFDGFATAPYVRTKRPIPTSDVITWLKNCPGDAFAYLDTQYRVEFERGVDAILDIIRERLRRNHATREQLAELDELGSPDAIDAMYAASKLQHRT